jgi:hypothetical protein
MYLRQQSHNKICARGLKLLLVFANANSKKLSSPSCGTVYFSKSVIKRVDEKIEMERKYERFAL